MKLTLKDLANEAEKERSEQRFLAALDLPIPTLDERMSQFDTSSLIWEATQMLEVCQKPDDVYPRRATNWGLANTRDTFSYAHMDEMGAVTWIRVENGDDERGKGEAKKIWGTCHWHSPDIASSELASPYLYQDNPEIVTEGTKRSKWEFIALRRGDTM